MGHKNGETPSELFVMSRREALRRGLVGVSVMSLPGLLAACGSSSSDATSTASGAASGQPTGALKPFDPGAAVGQKASTPKILAFPGASTDPASLALNDAMKSAAEANGFQYKTSVANGDLTKITSQTETLLNRGFSGIFMYPLAEPATRPLAQRALDLGAVVVGGASRPYSTVQVAQDQSVVGAQFGKAVTDWIQQNLGGKAKVSIFNEDSTATIKPRHLALLAELKKLPGVEVVSDIEPKLDPESGANAMSTILQAHPDVNVILGGSGPIGGAYAVLDSKGKAKDPKIFVGSFAGSDADLAKIEAGDNVYRLTMGEPWPMYGWAVGQMTADWHAGKSIPRLLTPPGGGGVVLSTPEQVRQFRADMKDPQGTWENKRDKYVRLWGNINYETRGTYWRTAADIPTS
jgi:ribose transport system substrate-binding protein